MFQNYKRFFHRVHWETGNSSWQRRWEGLPAYPLRHYVLFTAGLSALAYTAASIVNVEKEKRRRAKWLSSTNRLVVHKQDRNNAMILEQSPNLLQRWQNMKESEQTIIGIIGMNVAIFVAWRIPSLSRILHRYFLHSIHSHPITLLTSVFSHNTAMHLGFNMMALYSFGPLLHDRIGREHFLAFYLTSGLSASLGSHLYKAWIRDSARSLGASGALFAVTGACAANMNNINVSLLFLPFISVPLDKAFPVIMGFDAVGLIRRWQSLDHAAHLSGALMGYGFFRFSERVVWANRKRVLAACGYPVK